MTDEEQRRFNHLQNEVVRLHKENVALITKFQADCLSCTNLGGEPCMVCSVNMKSHYRPVGEYDAD